MRAPRQGSWPGPRGLVIAGAALLAGPAAAQGPKLAPETGAPVAVDMAPETGWPVSVDVAPETGRPVSVDMAPEAGRPVSVDMAREAGAPVSVDMAPETGSPVPVDMAPEADRAVPGGMSDASALPAPRVVPVGRLHNYLGLVAGVGLTSRQYGAPAGELGRSTATTGLGGVQARLSGYADRHPHGSRVVRMTLPELMLVLELGGTAARRDAAALREGQAPGRSGVAAGASGLANIGAAFASPGTVGVYVKVFVGQRFVARSNTDLEGAYYIASAGPSVGLRVAAPRRFTLLLGGGIDGVLGVQRLDRSRLIAQLAPIADLGVYAQPRPHVYLGLVGRGDVGVLGERYGGRRRHGRAAVEVVWKLVRAGPARFAALLLAYDGNRVDAGPGHPQFAAVGERRSGHQLLLSGGVTF